jgi:hypothetical protein
VHKYLMLYLEPEPARKNGGLRDDVVANLVSNLPSVISPIKLFDIVNNGNCSRR